MGQAVLEWRSLVSDSLAISTFDRAWCQMSWCRLENLLFKLFRMRNENLFRWKCSNWLFLFKLNVGFSHCMFTIRHSLMTTLSLFHFLIKLKILLSLKEKKSFKNQLDLTFFIILAFNKIINKSFCYWESGKSCFDNIFITYLRNSLQKKFKLTKMKRKIYRNWHGSRWQLKKREEWRTLTLPRPH